MVRFFYDITQKRWTGEVHFHIFRNRAVPPKTTCKKMGYPPKLGPGPRLRNFSEHRQFVPEP